jgi:hypothetical protein
MSSLRKSSDLHRSLTWNGRSLKVCSKVELIDCIIHLAREIEIANKKLEFAKKVIEQKPETQNNEEPISLPV